MFSAWSDSWYGRWIFNMCRLSLIASTRPSFGDQVAHRRDPAVRGRLHVPSHLVGDLPRDEHRRRPLGPPPRQRVPGRHPPPASRVPPALITRYSLHHKGLLVL